jgi:Flp pilus assembly pilin Flp
MSELWNRAGRLLRRFHEGQEGASLVEYILVIVAVALPLLAVVVWFWRDIVQWTSGLYQAAKSGNDTNPDSVHHSGG